MSNIKLSPAERSMFKLCGILSIEDMPAQAGIAALDKAIDNFKPQDAIGVVNWRILEKIRNLQAAAHGIPATAPRQLRPYTSNSF